MKEKNQKWMEIMEAYTNQDLLVAFSGGVDSTVVLRTACELAARKNNKVYAVTIHTTLHPMNELELTRSLAEEAGAIYRVIQVDELENAGILNNPVDRCYRCKRYLFEQLIKLGEELGVSRILDGTNADDLKAYRPGLRALSELHIISPLVEADMDKKDVRSLARELGLSVAQKPSAPCLATRFPYGTELTTENLRTVEKGEEYLRSLGFYNIRIRVHGDIARIEVDINELEQVLAQRELITEALKKLGYVYITMDLSGFRSGSMDYRVSKL